MKTSKKILAAVLAMLLVFALASCGAGTKVYLPEKLQSDQGNATYTYDKKNQVLNVEATKVTATEEDGSSDFDASYGLLNFRSFKNNTERNYYLVTGDNYAFNPLIKNGTIKKMVITYPDNNKLNSNTYLFRTNAKNQVTSVSAGNEKFNYQYDKAGRLASKTAYAEGSEYYTTTFKYNKDNNIIAMAYKYSDAVLQQYQAALAQYGQAASATDLKSLGNTSVSITYDNQGRVSGMNTKGQSTSTYTYNNNNQLISITSNSSGTKASNEFKYDGKGNLEVITSSSTSKEQDSEVTYTLSKFKNQG